MLGDVIVFLAAISVIVVYTMIVHCHVRKLQ
jgi:hypothetical protein